MLVGTHGPTAKYMRVLGPGFGEQLRQFLYVVLLHREVFFSCLFLLVLVVPVLLVFLVLFPSLDASDMVVWYSRGV
jgi:hypothetical protein